MSKILVFGHQNPDSDAIGSSVAFAYLAKEAWGLDTEAVALGTPNEETAYVLDYFGVQAPRVVESAKAEGVETVILTDHNEFQQSISDIKDVTVYGVVDHHRVANFETANPLYMRLEPVGSASSIVYRISTQRVGWFIIIRFDFRYSSFEITNNSCFRYSSCKRTSRACRCKLRRIWFRNA